MLSCAWLPADALVGASQACHAPCKYADLSSKAEIGLLVHHKSRNQARHWQLLMLQPTLWPHAYAATLCKERREGRS